MINQEIEAVMCIAGDVTKEKNLEMIASKGQEFSNMTVEIFNRPQSLLNLFKTVDIILTSKKIMVMLICIFFMK